MITNRGMVVLKPHICTCAHSRQTIVVFVDRAISKYPPTWLLESINNIATLFFIQLSR